ncbi:arsenate reductase family protein [Bdellovibrio bacteriovorus]|uniref:arsenate reductase family protein n=1 Tax=Bdellovibrio bacteriovorus TaxID=959 RepID=UPI003AA99392
MTWVLLHNPSCSKSREAIEALRSIEGLEVRKYLENPLSEAELRSLIQKLGTPVSSLVRTKEALYTEAPFDVNNTEEVIQHLVNTPKLMERPILIGSKAAAIGRPFEKIQELLEKN